MRTRRRSLGAFVVTLGVAFAGAACGGDDQTAADDTVGDDVFPVTVAHTFGETTIESEPARVVVAGLHETDFLYSLGVAPVGVHEWFGGYEYATGPWAQDIRADLGATPEVQDGWDINVEWVAAQEPDLIVATYHELDQSMYDLLSGIAPVVAAPSGYDVWTAPWQVELRLLGEALGRQEQAEDVIAGVEETAAAIRAEHPEFEGTTINTLNFYGDSFETYSGDEALNTVLSELGFTVPASFDELAEGIYVSLSLEQIELLDDLDAALWFSENQTELDQVEIYRRLELFQQGRSIWLEEPLLNALAFNTPLSIPCYLERLAPMLAAAVDGDATTEIPEAAA